MNLPLSALLKDLLIGYMALFSIINPFGIAFVFRSKTQALPETERRAISRQVAFYSFIVLVVSLLIGGETLRFFGITVPALRIAGGLVVALSGWAMLSAPDEPDASLQEVADTARHSDMAFFPLTVPLTTGPGSIAAAIALGANRTGGLRQLIGTTVSSVLLAALVAATIFFAYSRSETFSRIVGHEGTRVITRLSAFLLMCVGVQIVLTGVSDVLPSLITKGIQSLK
jgi:multiple antibiotic resistance protein